MKSSKLKSELAKLEQSLIDKIKKTGFNESVEITGLKQPDISAWINKKRKWTYNKLLIIAEKFNL